MTKKKVYIPALIVALLGIAALVFSLTRPSPPPDEPPTQDYPAQSPGPPRRTISFNSFDEILQLRTMLEYDDELLLTFLEDRRLLSFQRDDYGHVLDSAMTRAEIETFFALIDNAYLPIDLDWGSWTYYADPGINLINILYGVLQPGGFRHSFRIWLDTDVTHATLTEVKNEWADITDELSLRRGQGSDSELVLSIGNGIRAYKSSEIDEEGIAAWFALDVQGTLVRVSISDAPNEDAMYEILANMEFARGMFAP